MKTLKILLMLMLIGSMSLSAQNKKKNEDKVSFDVSLSCQGCKAKLEKHIPWEKGVKDMDVNVGEKTVTIVYDVRKTTTDKLKKAIEKLDFTCDLKPEKDDK